MRPCSRRASQRLGSMREKSPRIVCSSISSRRSRRAMVKTKASAASISAASSAVGGKYSSRASSSMPDKILDSDLRSAGYMTGIPSL